MIALISHVPIISILIALLVAGVVVVVLEAIGVPRPFSWIAGLLLFLALAFG